MLLIFGFSKFMSFSSITYFSKSFANDFILFIFILVTFDLDINLANGFKSVPMHFNPTNEPSTREVPVPQYGSNNTLISFVLYLFNISLAT